MSNTNNKITNILIAGVGGQGLVLSTKLLGSAALKSGYDLKTSDVIGLAQRGGKVWGSVRFGEVVHSPLIPLGQCDLMIGLEELEALRWVHTMKKEGTIILNDSIIYPTSVMTEKEEFPEDIPGIMGKRCKVILVHGQKIAKQAGNAKAINTVLMGVISKFLPFSEETWIEVIKENVPKKSVDANIAAFKLGAELSDKE